MDELNLTGKATILVVDDVPGNLALMSNMLKDYYKVKIANNGEKALKIAASDSPPDLIMLDIVMPGMDGFEVCRHLKLNPRTMHIPVIFLTAKSDAEDEQKGLELGAIDYITKPISPPAVMMRVKNQLALQERSSREEIEARHEWLKKSLKKFITQLERNLPEEQGKATIMVGREKLKAVCDKLAVLLANDDAEAIDVMDTHAELLNEAFPNHCHEIDNYIRSFDFEAALVALKAATGTSA
ncbi:MAG: response regulator [Gallionella sp.]|nr:response regulator [Gallionella sp.]